MRALEPIQVLGGPRRARARLVGERRAIGLGGRMGRSGRWVGAISLVALFVAAGVVGVERGTPGEAKAMLAKAVAHYRAVGRQRALADFNKKVAPFGDRDLYVVCLAADHVEVANGGFPSLVGTSADGLKDADGRPLGKALWDAALRNEGSVRYRWLNPVSRKTEAKVSFVEKVGEEICVVGAYDPQ